MGRPRRKKSSTLLVQHATATSGFSGVFAVPTPVQDDSGVAHVVEHLVFRSSTLYPEAHNLFAALALLPLTINATTLPGVTYYFIETDDESLFYRAIRFVYAGILTPTYTADDIRREKDGVIFQELAFYERQPGYAEYLSTLMEAGRIAEAYAGGCTGTLPALCAADIQAYKYCWYQPGLITFLINRGDADRIRALLDKTVTAVLRDINEIRQPTESACSPVLPLPDKEKMPSPAIRELIGVFVQHYTDTHRTANSLLPLCLLTPITSQLNRPRPAYFPPLTRNNPASFVSEVKVHCPALPAVSLSVPPKYILRCWQQFTPFAFCENELGDWYYAFPWSKSFLPKLEDLLLSEAFWSPRISGDCYAMGMCKMNELVIIYAVNDGRSRDRLSFCESLRQQLFG